MSDSDKELMEMGGVPHDEELKALGAVSPHDKEVLSKFMSQPEGSQLESARAGLASGGTLGFAPRMGAALGVGLEKTMGAPEDQKRSAADIYNEYLKYNQARQEKAQKANPVTYGMSQFAGGLASPLNKIGAGAELAKDASLLAKMGHGAIAGSKLGALAGASQSPDLTDVPQTLTNAAEGSVLGAGIGTVAPPVIGGLKGLAKGAAKAIRPLVGQPGKMASAGFQAGMEGSPNLSGEFGQQQAAEQRADFADQFVQDVHNILKGSAKNKRELIATSLQNHKLAPAEAVDAIKNKYLELNPTLNEESARKELEQLKEMFITAAEGPKKTETVRQYNNPAVQPIPAPSTPNIAPGQVERGYMVPPMAPGEPGAMNMPGAMHPQPAGLLGPGQPNAIVPSEGGITGEAAQMQPPPPSSPAGFEGYEKVHAQTIDPENEKAIDAFHQKVNEKLTEEHALGKDINENDVQIEQHPIEGTDKVRMIAKRAITKEPEDQFKEQAENLSKQQKEAKRLQDLLDKQNEMSAQQKAQQEAEMAKPQFEDVQRETREGGRNLQNPEELYALQKQLEAKSRFSEGRGFSSAEMNRQSGNAAKDIAQLIKLTIPETVPVDERLNAFNNVAESLGINTDKLSLPGGEGQKARQDAMKKILSVLSPESSTDKGTLSKQSIDYVTQQLGRVHPDIGEAFQKEAAKHAERLQTIEEMNPVTMGGGRPIVRAARALTGKASYGAGYGIGEQARKMGTELAPVKQAFQQYTPEALQKAAAGAAQSGNKAVQQLGQVLSKLATADERTRNSMMFVLQQQAGYRQLMAPYFEHEEPGTPQAKDKTVEKYK